MMHTFSKRLLLAASLFCLGAFTAPAPAHAEEIVWQQLINFSNFSDWGPSSQSSEVADDFDVVGTITRIDVNGYGPRTQETAFNGVYVRFYAYGADAKPGALQAEFFIPKGDPRILNQFNSADYQIALGSAFQSTGKHFVSVQALATTAWYWRSANEGAPRGTALYFRASPSSAWTHTVPFLGTANEDTAFTLYGTRTLGAPTISALSATTLPQAGRLIITGSGFGEQPAGNTVKIGGATAPVSTWSDTRVVAYVPDTAPLGNDLVQVVTTGGTSNSVNLLVTARPAQAGHIKWRFQADDLYILSRPAVAPDGTVYALGVDGHLYALTPAGGVKWIFDAGKINAQQPVSVGPDGTIYIAVLSTIYAVNPDGTLKWIFTEPDFWRIFAGPTVGPDGNIYAGSENGDNTAGLGAFVLSPAGNLIDNSQNLYTRNGYGTIEIKFGPDNHWYLTTNASGAVNSAGSLFAFILGTADLDWAQGAVGQIGIQPSGNVVVGDGNSIHPGLQSFTPAGARVWRSLGEFPDSLVPGIDAQTALDVGIDGNIYVGTLTFGQGRHLTSLNPDGTLRWQFRDDGTASAPAASPLNTLVLFSAYDFAAPSRVHAVSTAGALLWTEFLPEENGGYVHVMSIPRFSPDGLCAYVGTDVNDYATDPYCYLYAFDTSTAPATDTVNITQAIYKTSRQQLTVQATSSNPEAVLSVYVTSTDTLIGTLRLQRGKYTGKFTWPSNPGSVTVKSSAGGTATKTVTPR